MGKDDKCCVPFCGNRRKLKRSLSYFRIPQNPVQRLAWLEVIRKDPATIAANDRICSVHFVGGKPSPFSQNIDWKPTLVMDKTESDNMNEEEHFSHQSQMQPQQSCGMPLQSFVPYSQPPSLGHTMLNQSPSLRIPMHTQPSLQMGLSSPTTISPRMDFRTSPMPENHLTAMNAVTPTFERTQSHQYHHHQQQPRPPQQQLSPSPQHQQLHSPVSQQQLHSPVSQQQLQHQQPQQPQHQSQLLQPPQHQQLHQQQQHPQQSQTHHQQHSQQSQPHQQQHPQQSQLLQQQHPQQSQPHQQHHTQQPQPHQQQHTQQSQPHQQQHPQQSQPHQQQHPQQSQPHQQQHPQQSQPHQQQHPQQSQPHQQQHTQQSHPHQSQHPHPLQQQQPRQPQLQHQQPRQQLPHSQHQHLRHPQPQHQQPQLQQSRQPQQQQPSPQPQQQHQQLQQPQTHSQQQQQKPQQPAPAQQQPRHPHHQPLLRPAVQKESVSNLPVRMKVAFPNQPTNQSPVRPAVTTVTVTTSASVVTSGQSLLAPRPVPTKPESHSCVLCNEKLPSKEALQDHFRCHANGEGFNPVRVMDKPVGAGGGSHSNTSSSGSGIETWTCDICVRDDRKNLRPLNFRVRANTGNRGRVFTSKSSYLTHHMRYHPKETGHFCPHCGRMFPLRVDRDRHLVSHPDGGPYTPIPCTVCKVTFYNNEALSYHMQNHQKVQEITSRVNDTADYIDDIRPSKRLRFDSMGEPQFCYYCPWCGKEYIQRYNLESHVRKMHQTMAKAERLFYCETCDSTFYNQSALMQHNFGHQQNQGYLMNPAEVCKAIQKSQRKTERLHTAMVELEDDVNLLNQIVPLAAANNQQQPAATSTSDGNSIWPDWMNALPVEFLRAIKQEPPASSVPASSAQASSGPSASQTSNATTSTATPTATTASTSLSSATPPTTQARVKVEPPDGLPGGSSKVAAAFPCHECGGNFPTMVALRQHRCLPGNYNPMIKKEKENDFSCGVCGSSFSCESELAEHLLHHEVYLCSDCGQELPNKTAYLEHQSHHSNGELRIPLNMFLPENNMLKKKVLGLPLKKTAETKVTDGSKDAKKEDASESGKGSSANKNASAENIKVESNTEQFVCGLCDQHFPDQSSLEMHFKEMGDHASHNSRFSVTCNVCGLSFTVEAFKKHTHERPANAPPRSASANNIPIKCGICQQNFSTKEEIDVHFASHPETARDASRRSFMCNVCVAEDPALALLASFPTLRELYDHHTRQHPQMSSNYQCRLCGMRFFEQWDLASHFAKHLPENIRNQCQVVFKNGQLKATFVCERCGQVFNYEVHLANHLRNNTCLKWACHICGRGNRSAKHRNQHIREHHPADGLRYVCGVDSCKRKEIFSKRTLLYSHIRSKHPELLQTVESNGKEVQNDDLDLYVIVEAANDLKKDGGASVDQKMDDSERDNGFREEADKVQVADVGADENVQSSTKES